MSIRDQSDVTSAMFDEGQVAFEPMDYSDYRTYMPYPWRVKKFSGFDWELPAVSIRKGRRQCIGNRYADGGDVFQMQP